MLIPNLLGSCRPAPGAWTRSRRGYAFAAALTVAVSARAVPAAAAEVARTAQGRYARARPAAVLVVDLSASGPGGGQAIGPLGARFRGAREPLAPRRTRTLVLAVIGGAAGLAVFAVGGLVAAARRRGGLGRRHHG